MLAPIVACRINLPIGRGNVMLDVAPFMIYPFERAQRAPSARLAPRSRWLPW